MEPRIFKQRKSPFYYGDYTSPLTGKRVRRSTRCRDKAAARRRLKTWLEEEERAAADAEAGIAPVIDTSMEDLAVAFLRGIKLRRKDRTFVSYAGHLKVRILPYFGRDTLASSITREDVEAFREALLEGTAPAGSSRPDFKAETPYSVATVNRYINTLRRMFEFGLRARVVKHNPAKHLEVIQEIPEEKFRALTREEIARWCQHLDTENRVWVQVAVLTGLRNKELVELTWAQVHFRLGRIRVHGKGAKSGKGRFVPLPRPAAILLQQLRPDPAERKGRVFKHAQRRKSTARAWEAAGFEGRVPTAHDLRHTFASLVLQMEGTTPAELQAAMGHSSLIVTERYVHAYGAEHETLAQKMAASLDFDPVEVAPKITTEEAPKRASDRQQKGEEDDGQS